MTGGEGLVLAIGAVLGDSDVESMAWSRAIGVLSQAAEVLSAGVTSPVRVNVVYHVDGRLARNEFEGVRTGRFLKAKSLLVVQAAVPLGPVEDRRAALVSLLDEAVGEAERYVLRKKLADALPGIRGIADGLHAG